MQKKVITVMLHRKGWFWCGKVQITSFDWSSLLSSRSKINTYGMKKLRLEVLVALNYKAVDIDRIINVFYVCHKVMFDNFPYKDSMDWEV